MIILYIPFSEENDLIPKAMDWKETLKDQNILIIQHGKKINYKLLEDKILKIYVLAHGINDLLEYFHLASHFPLTQQTTHLGIDKLAERFNNDFVYLHHQILTIKLYFCNNMGNQKSIAEKFSQNLILFHGFINFYAGTLCGPALDRKKYSHLGGMWYQSSHVRNTLTQKVCINPVTDLNIKELSQFNFFDKSKHFAWALKRQAEARHKIWMKKRQEQVEQSECIENEHTPQPFYCK